MNEPGNPTSTVHPDVRISATDFGPIASGTVDLRPLTVFVGPSNTGKTYFAILIYALHRILSGFPRHPLTHARGYSRYHSWHGLRPDKSSSTDADVWKEELQDVLEKLDTEGRPFRLSDLPGIVRDVAQTALDVPELLGADIRVELERCFDLESVSDLVRLSGHPNGMEVSLAISEEDRDLWRFRMGISESDITVDGKIEDMVLLPEGWSDSESNGQGSFRLRKIIEEIRRLDSPWDRLYRFEIYLNSCA